MLSFSVSKTLGLIVRQVGASASFYAEPAYLKLSVANIQAVCEGCQFVANTFCPKPNEPTG